MKPSVKVNMKATMASSSASVKLRSPRKLLSMVSGISGAWFLEVQPGHFAHYLGMKYSPFITAYAVHSGTLGPFHVLSLPAVLERKIPVGIWVGNTDLNGPSCKKTRDTFIDAGWVLGERLEFTEFPGGHEAPQNQLPTVWSFLTQWRFVD